MLKFIFIFIFFLKGNQVNVFINNCIYGDGIESISIPKDNKTVTYDKEKSLIPIIYNYIIKTGDIRYKTK